MDIGRAGWGCTPPHAPLLLRALRPKNPGGAGPPAPRKPARQRSGHAASYPDHKAYREFVILGNRAKREYPGRREVFAPGMRGDSRHSWDMEGKMPGKTHSLIAALGFAWLLVGGASTVSAADHWSEARIPGTSDQAVTLGRDLDGDGDPDEITIG